MSKLNKSYYLYIFMEVIRKKRKGFKIIEHNKRVLWWIIILLIFLIFLIVLIVQGRDQIKDIVRGDLCINDADCVPASCCHPETCTIKEKAPNCTGIPCTLSCETILDCGDGSCNCINNQCQAVAKA